jgi:hypothetical protein
MSLIVTLKKVREFFSSNCLGYGKPFYQSKTFWINVIAMASLAVQCKYGFIISPEEQVAVLGVINLILRAITKEEITLK